MLTHHLCKLAALAFVGLAVITLIGPVLAVLGVLLPFAVIGWLACLAYLGVRQAVGGRDLRKELTAAREAARAASRRGRGLVSGLGARLTAFRAGLHRASEAIRRCAPAVTGVLLEALCGAVVGAMLGLLANFQAPGPNYPVHDFVLVGGLTGAAAGLAVGLLKRRHLSEPQPSWRA